MPTPPRTLLAALAVVAINATAARATFTLDEQLTVNGFYELIGNMLVDAKTPGTPINNGAEFIPIDSDGDATTTYSSGAELTLPPTATVVRALVYVSATAENTSWQSSLSPSPIAFGSGSAGSVSYTTVTPDSFETFVVSLYGGYQGVYDVTSQVTGDGTYWVADPVVPDLALYRGQIVNWVLLVVYQAPGEPPRRLQVYRGGATYCGGSAAMPTVTLSGFVTPSTPPIDARLSVWISDGARGATSGGTPDETITVGGAPNYLENAVNPLAVDAPPYTKRDIGNSTVSRVDSTPFGQHPSTYNLVTETLDIDTFDASAFFSPGDTSKDVQLRCMSDGLFYHGLVVAFDVRAPDVALVKAATDLDGAPLLLGDAVTYTITATNGLVLGEPAVDLIVTDPVPAGMAYTPGTLEVSGDGVTWTPLSDAVDADDGHVTGALVTAYAGDLAPGDSFYVRFDVTVGVAPDTFVNTATASYEDTEGVDLQTPSNEVTLVSEDADTCDLPDDDCGARQVIYAIVGGSGQPGTLRCTLDDGAAAVVCDTEPDDGVTLHVYDGLYYPSQ